MENTDEWHTKGVWLVECYSPGALKLSYQNCLLQKALSAKGRSTVEDLWLLWKMEGVAGDLAEKEGGLLSQTATANKTNQAIGGRNCWEESGRDPSRESQYSNLLNRSLFISVSPCPGSDNTWISIYRTTSSLKVTYTLLCGPTSRAQSSILCLLLSLAFASFPLYCLAAGQLRCTATPSSFHPPPVVLYVCVGWILIPGLPCLAGCCSCAQFITPMTSVCGYAGGEENRKPDVLPFHMFQLRSSLYNRRKKKKAFKFGKNINTWISTAHAWSSTQ